MVDPFITPGLVVGEVIKGVAAATAAWGTKRLLKQNFPNPPIPNRQLFRHLSTRRQ